MTVSDDLARKLTQLPLNQQLEALQFVQSLVQRGSGRPRRDPEGLLAQDHSNLSLEEFREARREAWKGLAREFRE